MKKTAYLNLIKIFAEERRNSEERRKTDAPKDSFVEKRNQAPQAAQELAISTQPIRGVPLIALSPENIKFIELDKIIGGSYYAKVQNRHTGELLRFGTLAIIGEAVLNKKIKQFNEQNSKQVPLISENIPFHIENKTIIPFNANKEQYALFNKLFYIARNCDQKQCREFETNQDIDHSEAIFVENPGSKLFRRANYRLIIVKVAKLNNK